MSDEKIFEGHQLQVFYDESMARFEARINTTSNSSPYLPHLAENNEYFKFNFRWVEEDDDWIRFKIQMPYANRDMTICSIEVDSLNLEAREFLLREIGDGFKSKGSKWYQKRGERLERDD